MAHGNLDMRYGRNPDAKLARPKRIPSAKNRVLNVGEIRAIRHLSRFSMLTADQLAILTGKSLRQCHADLAGLAEKELACFGGLLPEDVNISKPLGTLERLFSLTKDGVSYVEHNECSMNLMSRKPVARSWSENVITDQTIRHKMGVVDCMIYLSRSVDTFNDLEIVYLAPDFVRNEDKESINKSVFNDGELIPDIVASVLNKARGSTREYYIEYDRNTEAVWREDGGSSLHEKFRKYDCYFGADERSTSSTNPKLLFVCSESERVDEIRRSQRLDWSCWVNLIERFRLASRDMIKDDFMRADWHMADSDERTNLLGKA